MSSLVILCLVALAVVVPQNVASSVKDIDVHKLLDLIQQNRVNRKDSSESSDSDDSDDSDSSDESPARSGRVGGESILDIINQAANSKSNKQGNYEVRKSRKDKPNARASNSNSNNRYDNPQIAGNIAQILGQILGDRGASKVQSNSKVSKKRLGPNRLLGNDRSADDAGLEDYSKIYVLLNPRAVQKSRSNKSGVNELISKILSLSSAPAKRDRQVKSKSNSYKSLAAQDNIRSRRARLRESRENSMEDKPKRGRNSGGGAGHTAIPYLHHRGENIYERDN